MNPIDTLFQRLHSEKRKAFIPFLTAGDPDLQTSLQLVRQMPKCGASLIEIGFPYSDPIADGAVIQASYTRALERGIRIDDIFARVRELHTEAPFADGTVPLVGMVSYSLVFHRGVQRFMTQAQEAGFSGAIIPDLPVDESEAIARTAAAKDFKLIQLITPTTPRERALRIARTATGFIYYVSIVGITGERAEMPPQLIDQLTWLRGQTNLPICVGFGISKPEHVRTLREHVDGVIVGSALVRRVEQLGKRPFADVARELGELATSLSKALEA
jgi:tryptophan synthase alpha chain